MAQEETKIETIETEKTDKTTKKNFVVKIFEFLQKHPLVIFWTRFVLWSFFACIAPISFLIWRFDLFKPTEQTNFGVWGIIAAIIVFAFIIAIVRYTMKVISSKSVFAAQCIHGVCRIILPLVLLMIICVIIRNNMTLFLQVLGFLTVTELIAIPLNPLPQWADEHQQDVEMEKRKSTIDYFIDRFYEKRQNRRK